MKKTIEYIRIQIPAKLQVRAFRLPVQPDSATRIVQGVIRFQLFTWLSLEAPQNEYRQASHKSYDLLWETRQKEQEPLSLCSSSFLFLGHTIAATPHVHKWKTSVLKWIIKKRVQSFTSWWTAMNWYYDCHADSAPSETLSSHEHASQALPFKAQGSHLWLRPLELFISIACIEELLAQRHKESNSAPTSFTPFSPSSPSNSLDHYPVEFQYLSARPGAEYPRS